MAAVQLLLDNIEVITITRMIASIKWRFCVLLRHIRTSGHIWLHYMAHKNITCDQRFHVRRPNFDLFRWLNFLRMNNSMPKQWCPTYFCGLTFIDSGLNFNNRGPQFFLLCTSSYLGKGGSHSPSMYTYCKNALKCNYQ